MNKPAFLITIDTEGDNLWSNCRTITTRNALFLPRFQTLCERYGFKPTWLTNYEMISNHDYVAFASDVIARGKGEIGMHLHAWNSPPETALTDDDWRWKPYLIEYPNDLLRKKIKFISEILEDTFNIKMLSHRSGRWAFDERYAAALREFGYQVDCSVTPGVSWRSVPGIPGGMGGSDYTHFPRHAYFLNENDISCSGKSSLLEIPMSTKNKHSVLINRLKKFYDFLRGKKNSNPSFYWLRPSGGNLISMRDVVETNLRKGNDYVEFMLHSSELMPGGSPTFKNEEDIEQLYQDLEELFSWLKRHTKGMTLSEYYQYFQKNKYE